MKFIQSVDIPNFLSIFAYILKGNILVLAHFDNYCIMIEETPTQEEKPLPQDSEANSKLQLDETSNPKVQTAPEPPIQESQPSIQRTKSSQSVRKREQQLLKAYGGGSSASRQSKRITQSQQFFRTSEEFDKKVVHDQINRSPSKQFYTFPKAGRFTKTLQSYCSTQFYDSQIQSQFNKRSAALGYGNKSDFTKCDKYIPGPANYEIKSVFQRPQKGGKFGYGREELMKQGLLGSIQPIPGPGTYNPKVIQAKIGYSLGERTSAKRNGLCKLIDIYLQSTTPSPGTYNISGMDSKGSYFIARYKGSGAAVFSPTSSHIIESMRQKLVPGPGTYESQSDLPKANPNTTSQYLFGTAVRKTQELPLLKTPGPGAYSVPSEFGDWDFPPPGIAKTGDQNSRFNKTDGFKSAQS